MRAFPVSPNIRSGSCHSTTGQTGCDAFPDQPDGATITVLVICGDYSSLSDAADRVQGIEKAAGGLPAVAAEVRHSKLPCDGAFWEKKHSFMIS
jgi:hypothetical protein